MNKKVTVGCFAVILMLCFSSVAMTEEMPGPNGDALWHYISKVSPYQQWSFWSDHKGMQDGRAPHAPKHKVFVNKKGIDSKTPPLQYGTIEVKENYSPSHELKVITVMYKIKGYNPKSGDWFWAKYSTSGETQKSGKLKGCIGCHATRVANDFVLVHEFK